MYENTMIAEALNGLKSMLGERCLLSPDIGADYAHDETPGGDQYPPAAVCLVKTTEEVSAILKLCSGHGVPVTPRGAGTGLVGGSVSVHGGVVLAMGGMKEILDYDEDAMTVRVQPGVLLSELKDDAAARGFLYAPDPGEKTATVGGNAATNAGGPSAVRYGTTKDNVLAATVVLPTGEVLELGGTCKSSSGYDLLRLVLGSGGTMGVITELTLRLWNNPRADVSLILPFAEAEGIPVAAGALKKSGLAVSVMEYIDTAIVEFAGAVTGNPVFPVELEGERVSASLLLTIEGADEDELDAVMERVAEMSEEWGALDILVVDTPSLKKDVWAAHDAFHSATEAAAKYADELNCAVPPKAMPEYFEYVKGLGAQAGLGVYAYGHAGDGGTHIYVCANDGASEEFTEKKTALFDAAYARCRELGGKVSSEHGIGYSKRDYLKADLGDDAYALLSRVKAAFDPKGIMNPGKVC